MRGFSVSLVALVLLFAWSGCNEAGNTVNRVQPNVVAKSTFDGEWYSLQTVIDTPYSTGFTFVGEQGGLEKITWEVQENYLIARRSYEFIANSEPNGIDGKSEQTAAVAIYKIESQFDIRRSYNPVTGEEQNVIEENSSDRPWYQRKYMRVDWSTNLITDTNLFMVARVLDGVTAEPVSYYVQDLGDDHPHRPKFEKWNGSKSVNYIDIVNKMYVKPQESYIEGWGAIPSCFLLYEDHLDCSPGEVTVRNSYLKVDPSRDYQPQEYTGDRMDRAGYFVTARAGYDAEYGVTEPARFRFANRHNIWAQSHAVDDKTGEQIGCLTDDQCSTAGSGSKCDLDIGKVNRWVTEDGKAQGACTLPYRERAIRPIAYSVSPNFPEDLWGDATHFVEGWNEAFVETVGSLRFNECMNTGGDEAACESERTRDDAKAIFVLCHNPVIEGDNAACGEIGESAQIGDLRHHLIGWVNEPHLSSPLGYGPSAADPESGEIIMANAFVYGAGMETLAAFARDTVALLNGDLTQGDITSGSYIKDWVKNQKAPGSELTGRPMDDHAVKVDGSNVDRINQAMTFDWAKTRGLSAKGLTESPKNVKELMDRMKRSEQELAKNGAFGRGGGRTALDAIKGTDIEKMLVTPEMLMAAGFDPKNTPQLTDSVLDRASPIRGMDPQARRVVQKLRDQMQAKACVLNADFADDGLLGLARAIANAATNGTGTLDWYGTSYKIVGEDGKLDYEAVRKMLRHPIFDAVTAHEVGHTLGLRHNFSGSYDSWNYHPEYWDLRDDGNMKPRYLDAMTPAEIDGRIREWAYSTVMDYGNNFVVTDANGIGHYDHAAIKLGYGDLVEVFDGLTPQQSTDVAWMNAVKKYFPVDLTFATATNGTTIEAYNYTDYPGLVGGRENLEKRRDVPYTALVSNPLLSQAGISDPLQDAEGRPLVPMMFCSDETADLNPDCLRYDSGADQYESMQSVIDSYYNYYVFAAYGRGRIGFSPESYYARITDRYFSKMQSANQIYSLYRAIFDDIFADKSNYNTFYTRPDGMGAFTAGVGATYQLFTQIITTPEPGGYDLGTRPDGTTAYTASPFISGDINVDNFSGRPLATEWDFDLGFFWFDQISRVGFLFDKMAALITLVDPTTNFIGRDTSSDVRMYSISYYSDFANSMSSFLRGLQGEDWQTVSPRTKDDGGLIFPDALNLEAQDMAGTPIDPNASFTVQLYTAVYSIALIQQTYDEKYLNSARIYVKGSPNGVDLAPGTDTVEFADPDTGLVYVATSNVVLGKETGVAAQMIDHANRLKFNNETTALRQYVGNLDLAHRLSWLYTLGGY